MDCISNFSTAVSSSLRSGIVCNYKFRQICLEFSKEKQQQGAKDISIIWMTLRLKDFPIIGTKYLINLEMDVKLIFQYNFDGT